MRIAVQTGWKIAGPCALLAIIAYLDYLTGWEISLLVLYAFPVAMIAWNFRAVWGLLMALVAAATWRAVDIASHSPFADWVRFERMLNSFVILVFIAFSVAYFKRSMKKQAVRFDNLKMVSPVCKSCSRISDGQGNWTELSRYLDEHPDIQSKPKLCPDCARKGYAANYPVGKAGA